MIGEDVRRTGTAVPNRVALDAGTTKGSRVSKEWKAALYSGGAGTHPGTRLEPTPWLARRSKVGSRAGDPWHHTLSRSKGGRLDEGLLLIGVRADKESAHDQVGRAEVGPDVRVGRSWSQGAIKELCGDAGQDFGEAGGDDPVDVEVSGLEVGRQREEHADRKLDKEAMVMVELCGLGKVRVGSAKESNVRSKRGY